MSNLHYLAKRRQKKEQQRFNAVQDLTCLAYEKLLVTLTRSGNTISDQHREALMEMLGMYSFIAAGKETGRWAFDLSVGGAKTQSVVAWCAALSDLQRISAPGAWWKRSDISVLITAAKVEALADTKRDLIASGVPADRIGLWHSYDFKSEYAMAARRGQAPKDHASEPSIDNPQALTTKQFCLVAHNRLRGNDLAKWYIYTDPVTGQELPRSVTFHDEAMITSDVFAVSAVELESATLALRPYVKHLPETAPVRLALSYIEKCLAVLDQDVAEQDAWFKKFSTHRPAMSVVLPDLETHTTPELDENGQETGRILTIGSIEQYIKAIQVQNRNGYTSRLVNFLKVADKPLRVLRSSGGAFFHYQLGIPAELENVVVLDASYGIRMLEKLDKTIKTRPSFDGRVADYSAVEAHFLKYNSGRGKMEQSFEKPWKTSRLISREVAEVVKGIPTNEGVLIFVFKQHGDRVNIQDQLVSDLIAEGIDPTSELDVLDIKTGEQRREKRIQFLTWGNETSLSEF
ncbi:MAG: hypothetical protein E6I36_13305, partial [Chloroflexi bacterium]